MIEICKKKRKTKKDQNKWKKNVIEKFEKKTLFLFVLFIILYTLFIISFQLK